MSDDTQTKPPAPSVPPVRITWGMMVLPEFWLMLIGAACGIVAISKRLPADSLGRDIIGGLGTLVGIVSAWLTQKAREAASPSQATVIQRQDQVIGVLASCVRRNHPVAGDPSVPPAPTGPAS